MPEEASSNNNEPPANQQLVPYFGNRPVYTSDKFTVVVNPDPERKLVVDGAIARAKALAPITDVPTLNAASFLAQELKGLEKSIENERVLVKSSFLAAERAIDTAAKQFKQPILDAQNLVNGKILAYRAQEQERIQAERRRIEEEAAKARLEAEKQQAAAEAERKRFETLKTEDARSKAQARALELEKQAARLEFQAQETETQVDDIRPAAKIHGAAATDTLVIELTDWMLFAAAGYKGFLKVELKLQDFGRVLKELIAEGKVDKDNPMIPGLKISRASKLAVKGASEVRLPK